MTQPRPATAPAPSPFQSHCWALALTHETRAIGCGAEVFAVPSASEDGRIHQVRRQATPRDRFPADGVWTCDCRAGQLRRACRHVGAAMLLRAQWFELDDAVEAARLAGLTARDTVRAGSRWDGVSFWHVTDSRERAWLRVRVAFDPRPGRGVGESCSCGQLACAHLGAVALRYAEYTQPTGHEPTDASDLFALFD